METAPVHGGGGGQVETVVPDHPVRGVTRSRPVRSDDVHLFGVGWTTWRVRPTSAGASPSVTSRPLPSGVRAMPLAVKPDRTQSPPSSIVSGSPRRPRRPSGSRWSRAEGLGEPGGVLGEHDILTKPPVTPPDRPGRPRRSRSNRSRRTAAPAPSTCLRARERSLEHVLPRRTAGRTYSSSFKIFGPATNVPTPEAGPLLNDGPSKAECRGPATSSVSTYSAAPPSSLSGGRCAVIIRQPAGRSGATGAGTVTATGRTEEASGS